MTDRTGKGSATSGEPISGSAEWRALEAHRDEIASCHLRDLFAQDPGRFERFTLEDCGLFLDYSKHRITPETVERLAALAARAGLAAWIERLFGGEAVNVTEGRPAMHMALRDTSGEPFPDAANDVTGEVRAVLERVRRFCEAVRSGAWRGHTGRPIRAVVNIGIGGSDLGPAMAVAALEAGLEDGPSAHFVSNLDSTQLHAVLAGRDPEETLFIIASKTFGTQETLTNATSARRWLVDALGDEAAVARHFVAVSTHRERVAEFGIDTENMFEFWDWVGGRYSLWSAIGLSIAVAAGFERFAALLRGANAMDVHFRRTPIERNMPALLGLLDVWNRNFLGAETLAVLPYDYGLRLLPDYLQQLLMESNGKRVARDGSAVPYGTCPVVWGGPGNNGQHAFYQLLHQGTVLVPADFIVPVFLQRPAPGHEDAVLANALAQTEALMGGRTEAEAREALAAGGLDPAEAAAAAPHRVLPGNQPTSTIVYDRLTPEVLGALVSLYEHRTFVQSVIWDINPFDQWGVELGKQLASVILSDLTGDGPGAPHDASTAGLVARVRARRAAARSGSMGSGVRPH